MVIYLARKLSLVRGTVILKVRIAGIHEQLKQLPHERATCARLNCTLVRFISHEGNACSDSRGVESILAHGIQTPLRSRRISHSLFSLVGIAMRMQSFLVDGTGALQNALQLVLQSPLQVAFTEVFASMRRLHDPANRNAFG